MANLLSFSVEKKERSGKCAARYLRRQDKIPAIIYGGKEILMVSLSAKEFLHEYYKGNIQSRVAELTLGEQKITVMPKDVQLHPVTDVPEHVDFQEIDISAQIKVAIHIKILNSDKCPGVKRGGVLNVAHRYVMMWCLPRSIPDCIEVDVSGLEIGKSLHIEDIALPNGLKPVDHTNFSVVSVAGREASDDKVAVAGEATAAEAVKPKGK